MFILHWIPFIIALIAISDLAVGYRKDESDRLKDPEEIKSTKISMIENDVEMKNNPVQGFKALTKESIDSFVDNLHNFRDHQ